MNEGGLSKSSEKVCVGVADALSVPTSTGLYCVTGQKRWMRIPTSTIPVPSVCVDESVKVGGGASGPCAGGVGC